MVRDNNHQRLRSLLTAGAKVDQMTKASETPLYWAAAENAVDCVTVLLAHGADPTVANKKGETPLRIAQLNEHSAVVALLEAAIGKNPFLFFCQKRGKGLSGQKKKGWVTLAKERCAIFLAHQLTVVIVLGAFP